MCVVTISYIIWKYISSLCVCTLALLLHPPRLTTKLYLSQGPSPRSSQKTDDVTSLKEVVTVRVIRVWVVVTVRVCRLKPGCGEMEQGFFQFLPIFCVLCDYFFKWIEYVLIVEICMVITLWKIMWYAYLNLSSTYFPTDCWYLLCNPPLTIR